MAEKLSLLEEKRRKSLIEQDMSYCTRCKQDKPISDFSKDKNRMYGINSWCKGCNSVTRKGMYSVKYKARNRSRKFSYHYKSLAGGQCKRCGYNKCLAALDFHHVEPENKRDSPSKLINKGSDHETILKEIGICILLCSNCHRELTTGLWEAVFIKSIDIGYDIKPGSIIETPDEKPALPDKYRYGQNGFTF